MVCEGSQLATDICMRRRQESKIAEATMHDVEVTAERLARKEAETRCTSVVMVCSR